MIRIAALPVIFVFLLIGCHNQPNATSVNETDELKGVAFSLLAFKTGEVSTFNTSVYESLMPTRYSDSAEVMLRSTLDSSDPSCNLVGLSAVIDGGIVQVGTDKTLMINIDKISDLQPLSEAKRKQLQDRSPTLSRAKMC